MRSYLNQSRTHLDPKFFLPFRSNWLPGAFRPQRRVRPRFRWSRRERASNRGNYCLPCPARPRWMPDLIDSANSGKKLDLRNGEREKKFLRNWEIIPIFFLCIPAMIGSRVIFENWQKLGGFFSRKEVWETFCKTHYDNIKLVLTERPWLVVVPHCSPRFDSRNF